MQKKKSFKGSKVLTAISNIFFKIILFPFSKYMLLLVFLLCYIGPFLLIVFSLFDPSRDTNALTNIGFALIGAISAICFSYARAIENGNEKLVRQVVHAGELAFFSAIFFLLGSTFKYTYLNMLKPKSPSAVNSILQQVFLYGSLFFYMISFVQLLKSTLVTTLILRKRLENPPSTHIDEF